MRISVVGSSSSFETIVVFKESIAGYLSFIYSSKYYFGINQWEWRVSTSDFFFRLTIIENLPQNRNE